MPLRGMPPSQAPAPAAMPAAPLPFKGQLGGLLTPPEILPHPEFLCSLPIVQHSPFCVLDCLLCPVRSSLLLHVFWCKVESAFDQTKSRNREEGLGVYGENRRVAQEVGQQGG